jgi:hypothetical protein
MVKKLPQRFSAAIGRACPDGIDVYFDDVGGPTADAVLLHLRPVARMQGFQVFSCRDWHEES